jgi:fructose-bisphosphate aldolase class II
VGNVHLQTDKAAVIDWDALRAIEAVTFCPLVLHGGSGIPRDVRTKLARQSRVKKFNIGTELRMAFGQSLREALAAEPEQFDRIALLSATMPAVQAATAEILRALWSPT